MKSVQENLKTKIEDEILEDNLRIANAFAKFFVDKVEKLKVNIPLPETIQNDIVLHYLDITENDISKAAKLLKNKKCFGPDEIPLRIIKDIGKNAPEILVNHFNIFTRAGLPEDLKISRITPLHKKGDKQSLTNYRPISNLSSFSKLYEKIILKKLIEETEGLEGHFQHAYRPNHSTTTALLELQHRIARNKETFKFVAVYTMDLSAAFDLLRPNILMNTLTKMGVSGGLAYVIKDFLSSRKIYVDINGQISQSIDMTVGCVQGSILGPRLFTLYTASLLSSLDHTDIVSYADDSYVIVGANTIEDLKEKVHNISERHVTFLRSIGMVVNTSKTELMILAKNIKTTTINIGGEQIKSRKSIKALGVTFQSDLKWDEHVTEVIGKACPKLSMLRKIAKNLTKDQFLKLATAQVFSVVYYASPVWLNDTLSSSNWRKLKTFHYRVLRSAVKDYKRAISNKDLDKSCLRATPRMWSLYMQTSIVVKIMRDVCPYELHQRLQQSIYINDRRPNYGKFQDNSKGKVGKHRIENKLSWMANIP